MSFKLFRNDIKRKRTDAIENIKSSDNSVGAFSDTENKSPVKPGDIDYPEYGRRYNVDKRLLRRKK